MSKIKTVALSIFPSGMNAQRWVKELEDNILTNTLQSCNDEIVEEIPSCIMSFINELTAQENTDIDTLVSAHSGLPMDNPFEYNEDLKITDSAKGLILKSPNGTYWRITVDNLGILTTNSI